jgi:hypothetical protein
MEKDPRPVIRGTAAWAIGRIGDSTALYKLEDLKTKEQDVDVRNEIDKGIAMLKNEG